MNFYDEGFFLGKFKTFPSDTVEAHAWKCLLCGRVCNNFSSKRDGIISMNPMIKMKDDCST